jgi:hypothetical protein
VRARVGEGAAGSGDGTPTGEVEPEAEQGATMAAVATVVTLGAGDLNSAESRSKRKIKVFSVFFSPAAGWDCMPTYGRFFLNFFSKKVISL